MINYTEDDSIHVKHDNGQVFEPVELSQSTKNYCMLLLELV